MHWTITRKLFLALLVISLFILAMSALFGRLSFQSGFNAYLEARETPIISRLAIDVATEYEENGWDALRNDPSRWHDLLQRSAPRSATKRRPPPGGKRGRRPERGPDSSPELDRGPPGPRNSKDPLRMGDRIGLYDLDGLHIAGRTIPSDPLTGSAGGPRTLEVDLNQEPIAELRIVRATQLSAESDIAFDERQKRSILWIAALLLVLAWIASWLIARQFTKPIRSLAEGTRAMSNGEYDKPIAVDSNDELGALATDVNSLARVLAANRESRRRWLGDINHELRTPLTVLTAELQSLEDGFRPFNAESVNSLQNEVDRLSQLVDDLYSLSASDEGHLEYKFSKFDIVDLLKERLAAAESRMADKGLVLETDLPQKSIELTADETRIGQLITNLLENAIRYTDTPGVIRLSGQATKETFTLSIDDTEPGVPEELHERIFERLYRVDSSRNRRSGGSGLGLSICAAIVEAHHGTIKARTSDLHGLRVEVQLPRVAK